MPIEHWNNFYKYLKEKSLQLLCFLKCLTDSVTIRFMILRPLTTRGHPLTTWTLALHSLLHSTSDYNSHHPLHWRHTADCTELEDCTGSKLMPEPWPVPEIVWPDPSVTVKFRARTRPEIPPPPAPQRITNKKRKKVAFHDCIQRNGLIKALPFHKHLLVIKVCEHQVQRSHTF